MVARVTPQPEDQTLKDIRVLVVDSHNDRDLVNKFYAFLKLENQLTEERVRREYEVQDAEALNQELEPPFTLPMPLKAFEPPDPSLGVDDLSYPDGPEEWDKGGEG